MPELVQVKSYIVMCFGYVYYSAVVFLGPPQNNTRINLCYTQHLFMKHVDIGNFEPLVLQIWSTCSARGNTKISLLIPFSFCLIMCVEK